MDIYKLSLDDNYKVVKRKSNLKEIVQECMEKSSFVEVHKIVDGEVFLHKKYSASTYDYSGGISQFLRDDFKACDYVRYEVLESHSMMAISMDDEVHIYRIVLGDYDNVRGMA